MDCQLDNNMHSKFVIQILRHALPLSNLARAPQSTMQKEVVHTKNKKQYYDASPYFGTFCSPQQHSKCAPLWHAIPSHPQVQHQKGIHTQRWTKPNSKNKKEEQKFQTSNYKRQLQLELVSISMISKLSSLTTGSISSIEQIINIHQV